MPMTGLLPDIGYFLRPMPGETACGDACGAWNDSDRIVLTVVDGLGHGVEAAVAADAAIRCIERVRAMPCEQCFVLCDRELFGTRGVAMGLAIVNPHTHRLTIATVGNIRAVLLTHHNEFHLGGGRGVVGAGFDSLVPDQIDLTPGDTVLLYSDGFDEFLPWRDELLPHLDAPRVAEEALRRWARNNDDAAILVYRHGWNDASGAER